MKIHFLGTGTASVTKCFNTCFTIENENKHFLVDTGGGNGILTQLEKANIDICQINNIFVSHIHIDHSLGLIWLLRFIRVENKYNGNLNIYAEKGVIESLLSMMQIMSPKNLEILNDKVKFIEIEDGRVFNINGSKYEFINMLAKKVPMYGFKILGKEIVFTGDETLKEEIYDRISGCNLLMHESFCLENEIEIKNPYPIMHCTVKDAANIADKIKAKKLLLYHTMDYDLKNRKKLYKDEARKYFNGEIFIPDDLEVITIM